jgi:hypothetical protein
MSQLKSIRQINNVKVKIDLQLSVSKFVKNDIDHQNILYLTVIDEETNQKYSTTMMSEEIEETSSGNYDVMCLDIDK